LLELLRKLDIINMVQNFKGGKVMKAIAVFCGSSKGASQLYEEGAVKLGKELAKRNITLIYGGASVGIMGTVADTVLEHGGKVIGVIPKLLKEREIYHQNLTELIIVETMHERKTKIHDLADGFIALPGGPGTMDEFFESFTWSQLGIHQKPCGIFNINGYYDLLISFFQLMNEQEFLQEQYLSKLLHDKDCVTLLDQFTTYEAPEIKTYSKA
jgi:uncharacterized protein (TIGR00730 family)